MLAARQIIFTAVEDVLDNSAASSNAVAEGLDALTRRGIPLVLASRGTRAQLDSLRRRLQHGHPFLTESGGGIFIPDGYFNQHLEGATRCGRNFCIPFAKSHAEAAAALPEIAAEAEASVVGFSQMSLREIARNTGLSTRDAELYKEREFGEIFFFAGETEQATQRFSEVAREKGWNAVPGEPFWELRAPIKRNGEGAIRHLMSLFRKALHVRQHSAGIANHAADLYLLSAMDIPILLPTPSGGFDESLVARLPRAAQTEQPGPDGWGEAIAHILEKP